MKMRPASTLLSTAQLAYQPLFFFLMSGSLAMRKIDWLYLLSGVSRTISGGFSHKVYDF